MLICVYRSTPNLIVPEENVHLRVGQRSPLAARRVRSASSIQKTAVDKEKRYSAIFSTLR